ncbi:MAG TPA: hypothetical protein VF163_05475 [Micromonosporaceae bacterium]
MTRRLAVAMLVPPLWQPPGVDPHAWRVALAEDVLDVLARLTEVEAAIAVEADAPDLAGQVGWPGLRSYLVPAFDVVSVLRAAADDGFDQAVLLAADAPDLPGMLIAKLLRPLTTRPVAVAPAVSGSSGLLGLSARLPVPDWLPAGHLDDLTPQLVRQRAPMPSEVAPAPGWHRLREPADLARLDPRLEGWEATRALLSATPEAVRNTYQRA